MDKSRNPPSPTPPVRTRRVSTPTAAHQKPTYGSSVPSATMKPPVATQTIHDNLATEAVFVGIEVPSIALTQKIIPPFSLPTAANIQQTLQKKNPSEEI